MASFIALPDELIFCIIEHAHLPSLLNLSLTCSRARRLCEQTLLRLRKDILEKYSSNRRYPTFGRYPWHRLLLLILSHQVPASYVVELLIPDSYNTLGPSRPAQEVVGNSHTFYDELIHAAVQDSPWTSPEQKTEHVEEIIAGSEDATLAVLLPLLTGLRWLVPPIRAERTSEVFRKIVCAHIAATPAFSSSLPFSRLLIIWTWSIGMECEWPLPHVPAYLGLPGLRRVILSNPRDQHFDGWPATMPRPRCPEVCFSEGSVSLEAIQKFAKAWDAPCVIRQSWSDPTVLPIEGPEEPEWDCCKVEGDVGIDGRFVEGAQRVTLSLEDGGAIFSTDAVWAAELANGRMNDWRRLVERNDLNLLQQL